jgi:hypothetical protein
MIIGQTLFSISSWAEGRHNIARPTEPYIPRAGGFPLGTIEKIREEMTELL